MNTISKHYAKCKHNPQLGLFILRVVLGVIFIAHGWQMVTLMPGVIGFFGYLGLAPFWAYVAAYGELLAGIAMVLGIFTRFAGYILSIIMIVAIVTVKSKIGFLSAVGAGSELDYAYLAMALCISLSGPGMFALGGYLPLGRKMGGGVCATCDMGGGVCAIHRK